MSSTQVDPTTFQELPEVQVFKTVLRYCILIIALPLVSFYLSKVFVFDGLFGLNSVTGNVWAAVVSVVALHLALGAFIFRAYFGEPTKIPSKVD